MSHDRSEVDVADVVFDFDLNGGYYGPRPFHVAGSLSSQAGQGLRREAPRAAAAECDGTLHKWYVTRLSQPHTGTASEGSSVNDDVSGLPSEESSSDSSKARKSPISGSKRGHEGNIRTENAICYSCDRRLVIFKPI